MRTILKSVLILLFALAITQQANARKLLDHLNLESGHWVMVGVSLHNYKILPIQEELGTFIVKDIYTLTQIKEEWEFEEKYDDYCDFHYAMKFYRNGQLMETMLVNLHCNYITIAGLSYEFNEDIFRKHEEHFQRTKWSRIRFSDLDMLKGAVEELDLLRGIYWYGDVKQYNFKGNFMMGLDHIPWDSNRDSLVEVVTDRIAALTNREDFYVSTHVWYLSDDFEEMTIRFNVFCNDDFFEDYRKVDDEWLASWRNHFSEQSFVQIVVIGLNKRDYFRIMNR